MKKLLMMITMIMMIVTSSFASKCQKCKDIGFHYEYVTCDVCEGKGTVLRCFKGWKTVRCPNCGKIGNNLGKIKVKVYCACKTGKAKKERDEKPRKMTLK